MFPSIATPPSLIRSGNAAPSAINPSIRWPAFIPNVQSSSTRSRDPKQKSQSPRLRYRSWWTALVTQVATKPVSGTDLAALAPAPAPSEFQPRARSPPKPHINGRDKAGFVGLPRNPALRNSRYAGMAEPARYLCGVTSGSITSGSEGLPGRVGCLFDRAGSRQPRALGGHRSPCELPELASTPDTDRCGATTEVAIRTRTEAWVRGGFRKGCQSEPCPKSTIMWSSAREWRA